MRTPGAGECRCWVSPRFTIRALLPESASCWIDCCSSSVSSPPVRYPFGASTAIGPTWRVFIGSSVPFRSTAERLLPARRFRLLRVDCERPLIGLARLRLRAGVLVRLAQPHPRLHVLVVDARRTVEMAHRVAVALLQEVVVAERLQRARRVFFCP